MDALEMTLLLDYYGGMLTDKQRAVLEYYDKNHITKKDGDFRRLVGFWE